MDHGKAVKLHVPALDIDCWLDGTHIDHPDNRPGGDDDDDGNAEEGA